MKHLILWTLILACAPSLALAQDKKDEKAPVDYVIGDPHVQTIAPVNFACLTRQTTFANITQTISQALPILTKAAQDGTIKIDGPVIFTYKGVDMADPNKPFTLEIGFKAMEGSKETADLKIKTLPQFKCATILFTGPVKDVGRAYEKLIPAITQAGHKMTGESREFYLYWESAESRNNVVQIQVGIE